MTSNCCFVNTYKKQKHRGKKINLIIKRKTNKMLNQIEKES